MMELDRIRCSHCGKFIEFERPLFCPFCGGKLDAAQGLSEEGDGSEVYPWGSKGPRLMRLFLYWCALVIPVTWLTGRGGFIVFFAIYFAVSLIVWFQKSPK